MNIEFDAYKQKLNEVRPALEALADSLNLEGLRNELDRLQAMQEAASTMATYSNSIKQIVATRQAFVQSQTALTLSLDLYKQGLTTFQSVLDAQRSLLSYEESLVQAQAASLIALVQLYQALGGGWK